MLVRELMADNGVLHVCTLPSVCLLRVHGRGSFEGLREWIGQLGPCEHVAPSHKYPTDTLEAHANIRYIHDLCAHGRNWYSTYHYESRTTSIIVICLRERL